MFEQDKEHVRSVYQRYWDWLKVGYRYGADASAIWARVENLRFRYSELPMTETQRRLSDAGACLSGREFVGERDLIDAITDPAADREDLMWLLEYLPLTADEHEALMSVL